MFTPYLFTFSSRQCGFHHRRLCRSAVGQDTMAVAKSIGFRCSCCVTQLASSSDANASDV